MLPTPYISLDDQFYLLLIATFCSFYYTPVRQKLIFLFWNVPMNVSRELFTPTLDS